MNFKIFSLSISLFVLGILIGFFANKLTFENPSITGQVINSQNQYSYTTAICNEENECIDVLVECSNGQVVSLTPTSEIIKLNEEWKDFRDKEESFCEN